MVELACSAAKRDSSNVCSAVGVPGGYLPRRHGWPNRSNAIGHKRSAMFLIQYGRYARRREVVPQGSDQRDLMTR